MPYAERCEPRIELKAWLQEQGITYTALAERCQVSRQAVNQYANGTMHGMVIRNELKQLGCPEAYLRKKARPKANPRKITPIRRSGGYWNPWAEGEIICPPGVSSKEIIMNPLG